MLCAWSRLDRWWMLRQEVVEMGERPTIGEVLEAARSKIDRLSPASAHDEIRAGAVHIDLRCQELRDRDGAVPGALSIPLSVLYWRLDPTSEGAERRICDPDRRVILMCAHGYSSSLAAATLRDLGFSRAADIDGGFEAWAGAGLPVEKCSQLGRVSRIRTRTTKPAAAVSAATAAIATDIPNASARTPATIAPATNPRSRQSR